MKQMLLILNPISGTKKAAKKLSDIISLFNRADFNVQVFVTAARGDATDAVRRLGKRCDLIVCCGGDGTLNETVTGLLESGLSVPLGYIPSGSTNDFANSLHLESDHLKAVEQILSATPRPLDVGKFENRYFTYVASFGAFTKASYATPQNVKNALGHMAYLLEGIQELSKIQKKHVCMKLDDETVEDDFLFGAVCNSTSVGGILTLNPDLVDLSDGKFEVLLVRAPKDLPELSEFIMALRNQTYNCGMMTFRSARKISVLAEEGMVWSLDGERADGSKVFEIENLHRKIWLML